MKILIATGIFPPEVGGPAKYAQQLALEFGARGHEVVVIPFSSVRQLPSGIRHGTYVAKLALCAKKVDFILALDTFSAGFPALVVAKLFGKKVMMRIGGDFLWESYIERTGAPIYLREFYSHLPRLSFKERVILLAIKAIARHADALVFNTAWQGVLFADAYKARESRVFTIENFYPPKASPTQKRAHKDKKLFLWAGRLVKFKNTDMLKRVFEKAARTDDSITLEITANASVRELEKKLKSCWAVILPSLTEIGPNTLCEGLAFNTPFILSRETGLYERLKDIGLFVDPRNEQDIQNKILFLADEKNREEYARRIARFRFEHSWPQIADEFLVIYEQLRTRERRPDSIL